MNTKAVFFLVCVVLMAFVTAQGAHAFTAGGGGNIPGAGKREYMVLKRAVKNLCLVARAHCKRDVLLSDE
ncbi:hypothetical protein AC249_AIPGENE2390 [Exaiptasia diaphana]|nr:hypothetical protein AC249_AIPGENE2390 [Exaiptasia diaphana]